MRAYPLIHEEGVIGACPRFWRRTKGWSLRPAARLLVASISAVLSGCPSAHHDASGALCGPTTAMPGWIGNSYLADSEGESLSYSICAQEPVSTIPQTAPGGEKMYWIILGGRVETGDRSKPQQFAINSKPLIYWADRARLEVNGKSVAPAAMAVFHVGDNNAYSIPTPDRRTAVSGEPIDLNQPPRPILHLGFPVKLRASDHWVFLAGSARIGVEDVPIPQKESCVRPAWDEPRNLWQM